MLNRWQHIVYITAVFALVAIAASAYAQQAPLLVIQDSGWANTGYQSTPPAALIMSMGACNQPCSDNMMSMLNALTFYPSTHIQTVTITSAWGNAFTDLASVFAQGGEINWSVIQVLSNDGLVPSNFLSSYQGNGSSANLKSATVTSIEVIIKPFAFHETSIGDWTAIGSDGLAPQMTIRVYATY